MTPVCLHPPRLSGPPSAGEAGERRRPRPAGHGGLGRRLDAGQSWLAADSQRLGTAGLLRSNGEPRKKGTRMAELVLVLQRHDRGGAIRCRVTVRFVC